MTARRLSGAGLVVAAVAMALYANGVPGDFVFDDKLIVRDPRIAGKEPFVTVFVTDYWYGFPGGTRDLYRPLTIASYALNRMLTGLRSPWFHAVNVVLHAVVCVLLVRLVDAVLGRRRLAVAAGLLFAAHPVHTEAVTGIVGRAELLAAAFLLAALLALARDASHRIRPGTSALAGFLYLCALGSKETALVGPGLAALVDFVGQRRALPGARPGGWDRRRTVLRTALFAAVLTVFVAIRFAVLGRLQAEAPKTPGRLLHHAPLETRLFTALQVFGIYLRLLLAPITLSADYSYRQVPPIDAPNALAVAGAVALVLLGGATVAAAARRAAPPLLALGLFFVPYAIVANFPLPIGVLVGERLLYLPSAGFCVAVAWLWEAWLRAGGRRAAGRRGLVRGALAALILAYGARTVVRNLDWRNAETLYAATVRASPESGMAHYNYATVLMQDPANDARTLAHLERAHAIRPDLVPAIVMLTRLYLRTDRLEDARAAARRGLALAPDNAELRLLLSRAVSRIMARSRDRGP